MKITALFIILFSISACSFYRSQGRKQFESDSPGKIQSFSLLSCQKQNALSNWIQSEFPSNDQEIVLLENDIEVTAVHEADGPVYVQSKTLNDEEQIEVCHYQFDSEDSWNQHKAKFIEDLKNNSSPTE